MFFPDFKICIPSSVNARLFLKPLKILKPENLCKIVFFSVLTYISTTRGRLWQLSVLQCVRNAILSLDSVAEDLDLASQSLKHRL